MEKDKSKDVVTWVRLPKGANVKDLKKLGISEAGCYGGDTCIAATSPDSEAGLLIHQVSGTTAKDLLKAAGLNPRAECFGGDTCIV
jgi:hypothetical protein